MRDAPFRRTHMPRKREQARRFLCRARESKQDFYLDGLYLNFELLKLGHLGLKDGQEQRGRRRHTISMIATYVWADGFMLTGILKRKKMLAPCAIKICQCPEQQLHKQKGEEQEERPHVCSECSPRCDLQQVLCPSLLNVVRFFTLSRGTEGQGREKHFFFLHQLTLDEHFLPVVSTIPPKSGSYFLPCEKSVVFFTFRRNHQISALSILKH